MSNIFNSIQNFFITTTAIVVGIINTVIPSTKPELAQTYNKPTTQAQEEVATPSPTQTPSSTLSITPSPTTTSKPTLIIEQKRLQIEQALLERQKELSQNSNLPQAASITYSEAECEKQMKEILPKVETSYIDWWNQFKEAKKTISPCYEQEANLICDNKMSKLNVEWQNKITETINNYKKELSSCNPNNIKFSRYSDVISTSY